jgi:ABC-type multidrug transport system ATPase subunit
VILKNPKILILDEATSALDRKAEADIQATLDTLVEGRTTIIVSHRLSTIQNSNKIIVIENGRVVDEGDDASLRNISEKYRNMLSHFGSTISSETIEEKSDQQIEDPSKDFTMETVAVDDDQTVSPKFTLPTSVLKDSISTIGGRSTSKDSNTFLSTSLTKKQPIRHSTQPRLMNNFGPNLHSRFRASVDDKLTPSKFARPGSVMSNPVETVVVSDRSFEKLRKDTIEDMDTS